MLDLNSVKWRKRSLWYKLSSMYKMYTGLITRKEHWVYDVALGTIFLWCLELISLFEVKTFLSQLRWSFKYDTVKQQIVYYFTIQSIASSIAFGIWKMCSIAKKQNLYEKYIINVCCWSDLLYLFILILFLRIK